MSEAMSDSEKDVLRQILDLASAMAEKAAPCIGRLLQLLLVEDYNGLHAALREPEVWAAIGLLRRNPALLREAAVLQAVGTARHRLPELGICTPCKPLPQLNRNCPVTVRQSLAFCMGLHPRLGSASVVLGLSESVACLICSFVMHPDNPVCHKLRKQVKNTADAPLRQLLLDATNSHAALEPPRPILQLEYEHSSQRWIDTQRNFNIIQVGTPLVLSGEEGELLLCKPYTNDQLVLVKGSVSAAALQGRTVDELLEGDEFMSMDRWSFACWTVAPRKTDQLDYPEAEGGACRVLLGAQPDTALLQVWYSHLGVYDSEHQGTTPTELLARGHWHHVASVTDTTAGTHTLFVNGQLVQEFQITNAQDFRQVFKIGNSSDHENKQGWGAPIAGVKIWDKCLSDLEILDLALRTAPSCEMLARAELSLRRSQQLVDMTMREERSEDDCALEEELHLGEGWCGSGWQTYQTRSCERDVTNEDEDLFFNADTGEVATQLEEVFESDVTSLEETLEARSAHLAKLREHDGWRECLNTRILS